MKISNKEKTMLCVLGSIIIGFLYYQFLYLPQTAQIAEKLKAESEIKQKYETTMNTINSMEDKKSNVKILNAKISNETVSFYPAIDQEKIIIELDKLLKDSGLDGGATFQPIAANSVENSKKEVKSLPDSSLQGIVDQYNNVFNGTQKTQQSNDNTVNNSTNSKTNNTNSNNTNGTSNANNQNPSKDAKKNTVQYLKCEVKFVGKYEDLDKFLNSIGQNEKKIVINSIKVSSDTSKGINGTIDLEYYSLPKIDDELASYLKWDIDKAYGKTVPFGVGTASDTSAAGTGSDKGVSGVLKNTEQGDFIASVKPIASDLPTIMIGKAKDDLRTTYVYADSNSTEQVELTLTQDGDKYYYKYKTSKGTFPANYDGLGEEFVPGSKNIVLDIGSRSRIDANDNSAMKLKIVNKTDKQLDVNISGDDSNNPRVTVEGDLNNVSVNNSR
ncbi:pilus assembly protein PilO [Clostridium sp.]|uniref:pilus assembly protein PilO n=1 Tax=Clostridium sp. TaxID=1506 RepID=UPI002841443B|nr:pilus assembly protein PilO [Clostridium sp.]MDR3598289.1 pilus assembly protein PilO [Clostridium sp.]